LARRYWPLGLALWSTAAMAAAPVLELSRHTPRAVGYLIGDRIEHRVDLSVDPGYQLEVGSLPPEGRLDVWLTLATPHLTSWRLPGSRRYRIVLSYQLVGVPPEPRILEIPRLELQLRNGPLVHAVALPSWPFAVAPIASRPVGTVPLVDELRASLDPSPIATAGYQLRAGAAGLILLVIFTFQLWRWLRARAGRAADRPFARAWAELRRLPGGAAPEQGARVLHRAFDRAAGRSLLSGDLAPLFQARPELVAARDEIEGFFSDSDRHFFQGEGAALPNRWRLRELCRRCRTLERQRR